MTGGSGDLLLFPCGGTNVGVWDKEISSVSAARPLHRLPLSPDSIAGMAIVDDRGTTVFDLPVCLGMGAGAARRAERFLLLRSGEETVGFAVEGKIETLRCTEDRVIELPEAVRTDVIRSCMLLDDKIVPIIQIRQLLARLQRGILDVPRPSRTGLSARHASADASTLRLFSLGEERFCVQDGVRSAVAATRLPVTPLPYVGGPVTGVVICDGAVIPVLDISGPLGIRSRGDDQRIIFSPVQGTVYGFAADRDLGTLEGAERLPIPLIGATAWIRESVLHQETVVPVIELGVLLLGREEADGLDVGTDPYSPASDFLSRFQRGSVEVMDFLLLGAHHALPREEVKEVLPPVPFRKIPGAPEIVLGIAARGTGLFPVLDLAAIFGRRTPISGRARMLRVANGDFQALVLVEETGDDRILTPEQQRQVPISLPHHVLYGCYLDGRAVRLIMNVHSLAVHFERTEVRELVASLAPPPEEPAQTISAPTPRPAPVDTVSQPGSAAVPEPEPEMEAAEHRFRRSGFSWPSSSAMNAARRRDEEREEQRRQAEETARREARTREEDAARAEEERKAAEELERAAVEARAAEEAARIEGEGKAAEERLKEAEAARLREEEAARVERERRAAEERERAAAEARAAQEAAAARAEEDRRAAEERAKEAEETARAEAERKAAEEAAEAARIEAERRATEERARADAEAKARAEDEQRAREIERAKEEAAAARKRLDERERQAAQDRFRQVVADEIRTKGGPSGERTTPAETVERPKPSRKALTIAAFVAALLVLFLYWASGPARKGTLPEEQTSVPQTAAPVQEPEAPLFLDVPPSMPAPDVIVYVVVKGDTLWGISERFTGDPFNYPRVAKDNSIATPDLIFPGQRIKLRQMK
jgi:chemotaxis signal transduction protein/nucleoid-associated protein YgaU